MHKGTETSLGYLGTGLTAAILFMLSRSVKTDPSNFASMIDRCMYLFPYFFISITVPMLVMGIISVFIRPSREMRYQYIVLTLSLVSLMTAYFLTEGSDTFVYKAVAIILGHFVSTAIYIPISSKNFEKVHRNLY